MRVDGLHKQPDVSFNLKVDQKLMRQTSGMRIKNTGIL